MPRAMTGWILMFGLMMFSAHAETLPDPGLNDLLQRAGVSGCLAVMEVDPERMRLSDPARCQQRFLPASTFKVVNLLIALETGVVRQEERFPWDQTPQPLPSWEKDLTLQEAMAVSAVPVFQSIARRIGLQRMQDWVAKTGYGNGAIGEKVDRFWLDGPLAISPEEQARFMARVATGKLPFSQPALTGLRRLIPQETIGTAHLYGKTGWAMSSQPMSGWYVGWLENQGRLVTFATHIRMDQAEQAPLRQSLALAALRQIDALDSPLKSIPSHPNSPTP
ncbi:MAG: class D beta-lactamase [Magnetococcales bacterium]|nr:class D beta-lactamase [Magnetococcales bacterium]